MDQQPNDKDTLTEIFLKVRQIAPYGPEDVMWMLPPDTRLQGVHGTLPNGGYLYTTEPTYPATAQQEEYFFNSFMKRVLKK